MKVFRLFLIAGLQMNSNEDVWIFCLQQRFWMQIWFSSIFIFTFASNCGTPWQHPMFKFKEKLPEVLTSLRRRLHIPCLTKASEIYLTTLPSSLLPLIPSLSPFLPTLCIPWVFPCPQIHCSSSMKPKIITTCSKKKAKAQMKRLINQGN